MNSRKAFAFILALIFAISAHAQIVLKQSTASQKVPVRLFLSSDHITIAPSIVTPTITVDKAGAGLGAAHDGTWAEAAGGLYWVTLDATDTATLGSLVVRVVKATCDDAFVLCFVVANIESDTYARLGAPAGASTAADIAAVAVKTGNLPASPAATGAAMTLTSDYDAAKTAASSTSLSSAQSDLTTLLSRLTSLRAGYLDNLSAGAVALASGVTVSDKTGFSLSSAYDPAKTAATQTSVNTIAGYVDTEVGDIKTVIDQFRFTVANQVDSNALTGGGGGTAPTADENATAVWSKALSSFTTPGTAGKYLSTSASGGVDSDALAAAIRDFPIGSTTPSTIGAAWVTAAEHGTGTKHITPRAFTKNGNPISGLHVWATIETTGTGSILAEGDTDTFGLLPYGLWLDPGTYYLHTRKAGYAMTHTQIVVASNGTVTYP